MSVPSPSEIEQLSARFARIEASLAQVVRERDNWRDAAEHWKHERKLREHAYDVREETETMIRIIQGVEAASAKSSISRIGMQDGKGVLELEFSSDRDMHDFINALIAIRKYTESYQY